MPTGCMLMRGWAVVEALALASNVTMAQLGAPTQAIALSGTPTLELNNANYGVFDTPTIVRKDRLAFTGTVTGAQIFPNNNEVFWVVSPSGLALAAREGDTAAGSLSFGDDFDSAIPLSLTGGVAVFGARVSGPGLPAATYGVWLGLPYQMLPAASGAMAAPDAGAGVTFREGQFGSIVASRADVLAFRGYLQGAGVAAGNDSGIWVNSGAGLRLLAREGVQAPGMPIGAVFNDFPLPSVPDAAFRMPVVNSSGLCAFRVGVNGGGVAAGDDGGIWAGTPDSLALVAREGDAAPDTPDGTVFVAFDPPVVNGYGQIAFRATITGGGTVSTNDEGIWAGSPGQLRLIAREGDLPAGIMTVGVTFRDRFGGQTFRSVVLDNDGRITFIAGLAGPVTNDNDTGIWRKNPGELVLVIREGAPAPGMPNGTNLNDFLELCANDLGQIAFRAAMGSSSGLWAGRPGGFSLIAARNGTLQVAPGDTRTLANTVTTILVAMASGGADGRPTCLSPDGRVAFRALFTDGSSGVFVTKVPGACASDFNDNSMIEVPDIFQFLSNWFAMDTAVDFDGDGVPGVPDIFAFLSEWFADMGMPCF